MNKEDLEAGEWYLCHSNHFPERTMVMHYHSNRFSNVIEDGELNVGVTFEYEILTVIHKMYKGKGKYYRRKDPERVVAEINYIKDRYPLSHVHFSDDLFILRKNYN